MDLVLELCLQMKWPFITLGKLKSTKCSKREYVQLIAGLIGVALFIPILPWTGRHNYRPVWEAIAAVSKDADYQLVKIDTLKTRYASQGVSSDEMKCLTSRDGFFDILESQVILSNSLGENLGLRSSSVPAFFIVNSMALTFFSEISRLDLNKSLIDHVAEKCQRFPARFGTKDMLDSSRQ